MADYTKLTVKYHHALFIYTLYCPHHTVHPEKYTTFAPKSWLL